MEHYELPLVFFTSLSQTAVGMALFLAWRRLCDHAVPQRKAWFITGVVLAVSLIGATFHLADPLHGYNAFINLKHSWLSREILAAVLFAATIALALLTDGKKSDSDSRRRDGDRAGDCAGADLRSTCDDRYQQWAPDDFIFADSLGDGCSGPPATG
ncbi:hypothetical protein OS31_24230 [Dickeya oryzae]